MAEHNPPAARDVPYPEPTSFAQFLENERVKLGMGVNEFARYLSSPSKKIGAPRITQWTTKGEIPNSEMVIYIAVRLGVPATMPLELAGYHEMADYIAKVAGRTGPRAAALEPLIAQVRAITDGLPEEHQDALERDLLGKAADWFVAAEVEATQLRKREDDGAAGTDGANRNAI